MTLTEYLTEAVARRAAGKYDSDKNSYNDTTAEDIEIWVKNSNIREIDYSRDIRDTRIFQQVSDNIVNDYLVSILERYRKSIYLDLPAYGGMSQRLFFVAHDKKLGAAVVVLNSIEENISCIYILDFDSKTRKYVVSRMSTAADMFIDGFRLIRKILDNA